MDMFRHIFQRLGCWVYGHQTSRRLYAGETEACEWCGEKIKGEGSR